MNKKIAALAGDGIGPEIMAEAIKVLRRIEELFDHSFEITEAPIGGAAWKKTGEHYPATTKQICREADAILFGSVGGPVEQQSSPQWKDCERNTILRLRQEFGFHINLRPVKAYPTLQGICPLNSRIMQQPIDIMCIRELSGDIYFGEHRTEIINGRRVATDVMSYDEETIASIAHTAFQVAMRRGKKVTSVDKANVLDCSRLWREVVNEVAKQYPECSLSHILVDNCAMQLIQRPFDFDVLLMPNMFGDILSDEASVLSGSLGMLPSASLNHAGFGLYEPSGGSAQDIAGKNKANPIGQILSAALMLKHSFAMHVEHDAIVKAVEMAINEGYGTIDIRRENPIATSEMGEIITNFITNAAAIYRTAQRS